MAHDHISSVEKFHKLPNFVEPIDAFYEFNTEFASPLI